VALVEEELEDPEVLVGVAELAVLAVEAAADAAPVGEVGVVDAVEPPPDPPAALPWARSIDRRSTLVWCETEFS
jgi:hypothetical protein